jgi:RimJ/RimL family protein N-acetyltransferase
VLRDATGSDLGNIRRWRNHPRVRRSSIFTDEITPEGHAQWWAAVQADPARSVLVFTYDGQDAGVVTFNDHDREAGTVEWGFFLDLDLLEESGDLLRAWLALEQDAIDHAFDVLGVAELGGRTLAWNRPVLELHRRFGFVERPERAYEAEVAGETQAVVWTALTADRRR